LVLCSRSIVWDSRYHRFQPVHLQSITGGGRTMNAVDTAVEELVAMEPKLKGRESEVAVVIVQAFGQFLEERDPAKLAKARAEWKPPADK